LKNHIIITAAKKLRQNQTEAEKKLWLKLRNRQVDGVKFRRQQFIGPFIVDFACLDKKLIIEIDGGHHSQVINKERDKNRTSWLEQEGYQVLRFWNNDIIQNLDGVLEKIREMLNHNNNPHLTSPLKGRGMITEN
jgi:very-short-patch-repair endonuclease